MRVCVTSRDAYSTELEALSISEVLLLLASVRLLMYLRRWNAWPCLGLWHPVLPLHTAGPVCVRSWEKRESRRVENERLKLMTFKVHLHSLCIAHWISYKRTATTYFVPGRESCFIFPCMRCMSLTQDNCFSAQPLFSWDVWLLSLIQGLIPYWTKHFCSLSLI